MNLGKHVRIAGQVSVVCCSVNFIYYSCPCTDFVVIKNSFTLEYLFCFTKGLILFQKSIVFPSGQSICILGYTEKL